MPRSPLLVWSVSHCSSAVAEPISPTSPTSLSSASPSIASSDAERRTGAGLSLQRRNLRVLLSSRAPLRRWFRQCGSTVIDARRPVVMAQ